MFSSRFTRARRLAACTALAVSAGMLLATPASAGSPVSGAGVETDRPAATQPLMPSTPPGAAKADARAAGAEDAAPLGAGPRSDVDNDGKSDLLVREIDGSLTFVTQTQAVEFARAGGSSEFVKEMIPLGDLDLSDGRPEILTLSVTGGVELYGNASTTDFSQRRWGSGGFHIYNKVFTPGDVNGDRRADLMARTPNGDLYIFLASGDASYPFMGRVLVGHGWQVYDQIIGLGDNDGDGKGDVLARTPDGALKFYGSTGDPLKPFKAPVHMGHGWDRFNQILPVDDQDGDGDTEVWAREKDGTLRAYGGSGTGVYDTVETISEPGAWAGVSQFAGAGNLPATGKEELLARDKAGRLYWYYSLNNGKLSAREYLDEAGNWAGANITNASSFDPNGESDLLEIWNGHLYVEGKDFGGGWGVYNLLVGPGDLNGDGSGDLLARDRSGNLYLYQTHRLGTKVYNRVHVSRGWETYNWVFGAGDYTNDGRADILARTTTGTLYLFPGTGKADRPFASRIKLGEGFNAYSKLVGTGDLTGDGKGDFVAATPSGDLYRFDGGAAKSYFAPRFKIGYGFQTYNGLY
ncbi:VCBS repeat-containing protein [Streptomyces sp. NPDC006553]|uniref:FG-GAP repeat domain-containing protein n=1 Tax=Streptomyces sp. NPDC006553 TaxID=3157180 RepID=UPI0033A37340